MAQPVFTITFGSGRTALATELPSLADLRAALPALRLRVGGPVLVVVGGAASLSDDDARSIWPFFVDVLAPLVAALDGCVVDGGTAAGVMRLMGQARVASGGGFPLVGVAAVGTVARPDRSPVPPNSAPLDEAHTHFVFVPGAVWGDEVPYIAAVASALADGARSLTVLAGGGDLARADAQASIAAGRPVLVVRGSGGTAERLADALDGGGVPEPFAALVRSGLIQSIDPQGDHAALRRQLASLLE